MDLKSALGKVLGKLKKKSKTVTLHIAGGSASGKGYFTRLLAAKIDKDHIIITQDDYFRGKTYMEAQKKRGVILNFDQPQYVNLPLLKKHLSELLKGRSINKPIHNFKLAESLETELVGPKRIIIVDGLFSLRSPLHQLAQIKVFVQSSFQSRLIRRMLRDLNDREGWFKTPWAIYKYFVETVEPMHKKYIEPTAKFSDIIIVNEFTTKELKSYNFDKIQKKFQSKKEKEIFKDLFGGLK